MRCMSWGPPADSISEQRPPLEPGRAPESGVLGRPRTPRAGGPQAHRRYGRRNRTRPAIRYGSKTPAVATQRISMPDILLPPPFGPFRHAPCLVRPSRHPTHRVPSGAEESQCLRCPAFETRSRERPASRFRYRDYRCRKLGKSSDRESWGQSRDRGGLRCPPPPKLTPRRFLAGAARSW